MKKHTIRTVVPVSEIGPYMQKWAHRRPGDVTVRTVGKSGGYDIFCAVFTDPSADAENKQTVLITARHALREYSASNTVMSLGNYLSAGQGRTAEILKKMTVVLVLCPDPAGSAENVLQAVIDEYTPDLMLDCRGVPHENQLTVPAMGVSEIGSLRLYNDAMEREIQKASTDAGFAAADRDWLECLVQTDKKCTDPAVLAHYRTVAEGVYSAPMYAYAKYHTMVSDLAISWEEEGLARLVRALELGCEKQPHEYYEGYPTRTVIAPVGHNTVRAYGITAAARRKSRIELWNKKDRLLVGLSHPEVPGLAAMLISRSPVKSKEILMKYYEPITDIIERMRDIPGVDADRMQAAFGASFESWSSAGVGDSTGETVQIGHGMTVRLGMPFADAKVTSVLYNGHELTEDPADGYTLTKCGNWLFADIHIPPEKIAEIAIAAVTYEHKMRISGIVEFE